MKKFIFLSLLSLFWVANAAAARYEIDLDGYLPQQVPLKSIVIEADSITGGIVLNDGTFYNIITLTKWPEFSDIQEIHLTVPKAELSLITTEKELISSNLVSLEFRIKQQLLDGRRIVTVEFSGAPSQDELAAIESGYNPIYTLLKSLMKGGDLFHFELQVSANAEDYSQPSTILNYESDGQALHFELNDNGTEKQAVWNTYGRLAGKGSMFSSLISALGSLNKVVDSTLPQAGMQDFLQNLRYYTEYAADFIAPMHNWEGVGLAANGSAVYREVSADSWDIQLDNRIQLQSQYGNWAFGVSTKMGYIYHADAPAQWVVEVKVDNPAENISLIAGWIQANALVDFAAFVNTPSLVYYGNYFGSYFKEALATLMWSMGESQGDGSLRFVFACDAAGNIEVNGYQVTQFGSMLLDSIKTKLGNWW